MTPKTARMFHLAFFSVSVIGLIASIFCRSIVGIAVFAIGTVYNGYYIYNEYNYKKLQSRSNIDWRNAMR